MGIGGVIKFFGARAVEGVVAILLITFMPNLPPDAKYSTQYDLTPVMPFEGALTLNSRLQGVEVWHKGDFHGPEAFAVYNGEVYTPIHGGNVVKLIGEDVAPVVKFGKTCKGFFQEHICGRPLGMQFDKNGILYVADAYYGIFKVDVKTGKQVQLVSMDEEINGKKSRLPNSVAVASNGDVYWTDSSTEFFLYDGIYDMLADGSGRLIHYDAKNKKNTVLIDKVHFSNGVRLASDESFVIVTETARCRVHRYYLKGPKKGTHDMFLDGLPGLPDNIQTDGRDGFLIPLIIGRDDDYPPPLNILGPFPLTRKFFSRIMGLTELGFKFIDKVFPNEWAERAVHYIGHFASLPHSFSSPRISILHVSKDGEILDSIHSLDGSVLGMSEAFIFKDMLYLGSPFNDYIGRIPLAKVGWEHLALKDSDYPSSKSPEGVKTSPTVEPKITTDSPKMATQAPRVITQPPTTESPKAARKEEVHVHKREAPAPQTTTSAPKVTTEKPAPTPKPAAAPPKPSVPTPKPDSPPVVKPPAKPAAPASPPTAKPSAPAPPPTVKQAQQPAAKPAAPAPSPTVKPSAPAPPPTVKPTQPPAAKPAAPAPPPTAKPTQPPATKPAAPAPSPTVKPAQPPAAKPSAPTAKPVTPPTPKASAPSQPPPPQKPAVPPTPNKDKKPDQKNNEL